MFGRRLLADKDLEFTAGRVDAGWEESVELGDAIADGGRARQGWSPATPTPTEYRNVQDAKTMTHDMCEF